MENAIPNGWTQYFTDNQKNLMSITWGENYQLTPTEKDTILSSLQQFQLGESSEGKRLIALAEAYANDSGDTEYLPALKLFIKEEQRHASDLGRFMQEQGLPLLDSHPVDGTFRLLRRMMTLEIAIVVLLVAEIVAVTYYKVLHDATQSQALRTICRQILRDEIQHLNFQISTLTKLRLTRSPISMWFTNQAQRVFFAGTLIVVWFGHSKVYLAGGFSLTKFIRRNWSRFETTFSKVQKEHLS